ncbi:c-type cytochrome [Geothrix campi]|jgi:mono/diheme cytochrome c family protein|uniref:c-type cytochrome n=1 Tax=Geothrix campi TaxID=2966450 RepID=UPI002147E605|nr:cytochrome c [Geothrix sp. SG10]
MGLRSTALLLILSGSLPAQVRDLRAFYRERCVVCHGADGTGRGPNGARLGGRNLTEARWQARREDAALVASIQKGRGAMPGFGRQLPEPEARRLVAEVIRPMAGRRKP